MDTKVEKSLPSWLPLVVGSVLVAQFAGLGLWQVGRGLGKLETQDAFAAQGGYANYYDGADVSAYDRIEADGRFLESRQILLDNIIVDGRYGYNVLTPLELGDDEPLLLVNRGWIEKTAQQPDLASIAAQIEVDDARTTVRGRAGSLPRAMRMGEPFEGAAGWPLVGVYPTAEDIEAVLGRGVQPHVLLLDADEPAGFVRRWLPADFGPERHFGYAFQWFAMGIALTALLAWHYRRRSFADG